MQNTLTNQLGQLFTQLQNQLTPDQKTVMVNAMAALQHSSELLSELENADAIIHNCINAMTDEQRLEVAWYNHLDDLSAQWAFRSDKRKQCIQRGKQLLKVTKQENKGFFLGCAYAHPTKI